MKKIVLALLLVLALVSPSEGQRRIGGVQRGGSSGAGDPLRTPTGGGGVSGGACTNPSSGTVLGGQQTISGGSDGYDPSTELLYNNTAKTLTWSETCTTTDASKMQIYGEEYWGGSCKACLYTAAGALVACSNATSTSGWTAGWHDMAFASAQTITKDATYKMGVICNTDENYTFYYVGSGTICADTTGSYASPPTTLAGSELNSLEIAIRVVK